MIQSYESIILKLKIKKRNNSEFKKGRIFWSILMLFYI